MILKSMLITASFGLVTLYTINVNAVSTIEEIPIKDTANKNITVNDMNNNAKVNKDKNNKTPKVKINSSELDNRLQNYFSNTTEKRIITDWGKFSTPTKTKVEAYRKAIFSAAKRQAILDGRKQRFDNRKMIFNNPFGMDEKFPIHGASIELRNINISDKSTASVPLQNNKSLKIQHSSSKSVIKLPPIFMHEVIELTI